MALEVEINKEVRDYKETVFFGLNLRQTVCSFAAIVTAVGLYFLLNPIIGQENTSWCCILGAMPFVLVGFVKYNGMTAEKVALAFIKFVLTPNRLVYKANNYFYEASKPLIEEKEKEEFARND